MINFLQSIILSVQTNNNSRNHDNENSRRRELSSFDRANYDPIINYNNESDEDDEEDDELLFENDSSEQHHHQQFNNNTNNHIINSSSSSKYNMIKSSQNHYYSQEEEEAQYHNTSASCPPFTTTTSSSSILQNSSSSSSTALRRTLEKKNSKMSIELHESEVNGGTALDVDARYSRMSHDDSSSSVSQHQHQHHSKNKHKNNQRLLRGKLQTFIVGVRQCNPFAMFVALALLFILMGAIALFTLILCILLIESPDPIVILVSIDAFRYDFADKFSMYMPTLSSLRKQGVTVDRMQPCFPTKTFPNHYSIATGQYAENHGIVSNGFYDKNAPFANKLFKQTLTDPYWWSQGEPIWITAEKQNVSTATYDYPGGNVKIQGIYPSFYEPLYVKENGFERRLAKIEQYLKMKKDKIAGAPSLIMYYVSWVDAAAHHYGVPDTADSTTADSAVFYDALKITDNFLAGIMKKIEDLGMKSRVNFLIVSDHGMLNLSPDRTVWIRTMLEQYYNESKPANPVDFKSVVTSNTVGTLVDMNILVNSTDEVLKRNTINQLYTDLQETVKRYSLNCTIYKREEIPANYHYNKNQRIPDILLISDPGYYSGLDSSAWWNERGDHGYRNDIDEMYAFFTGIGPKLKSGGVKAYEMIQNIHIHSLIAELLKIKPAPQTDGNIESIKNVLSYELKK